MAAETVKLVLIPGSVPFLILGLIAGVLLLHAGGPAMRWGRWWLTALAITYLILSLPVVSNALIAGIEPDVSRIRTAADARGARVLVVLGNGVVSYEATSGVIHQFARRTAFGVLEGARLFRLIQPDWVIASGGIPSPRSQREPESVVIRDELVRQGVPVERILLESHSRNTAEQIANVVELARERKLAGPLVMITTPAHAGRVQLLANQRPGDIVVASAGELRYDAEEGGWRNWIPSTGALRGSETAIYEYLAIAYAQARP